MVGDLQLLFTLVHKNKIKKDVLEGRIYKQIIIWVRMYSLELHCSLIARAN